MHARTLSAPSNGRTQVYVSIYMYYLVFVLKVTVDMCMC